MDRFDLCPWVVWHSALVLYFYFYMLINHIFSKKTFSTTNYNILQQNILFYHKIMYNTTNRSIFITELAFCHIM